MTLSQKNEIISKVAAVLNELLDAEYQGFRANNEHSDDVRPVEMLTIKECAETVSGLSVHTVRQLVAQNKIPHFRTGQGKRGKILINKSALFEYLKNTT